MRRINNTTFMGGIFGVISTKQCKNDLFYGVDYHSHLGTRRGGMAVYNGNGIFARDIHSLENSYFRVKFEDDLYKYTGNLGIGVISDTDAQPIVVNSHLGRFAIVTVGKICNIADLEKEMLSQNKNFTELSSGKTNPTELIAQIITCSPSFEEGIKSVQQKVKGSCSFVLLTENCLIACRDLYGRTPLIIGKKDTEEDGERVKAHAVASETCSFPNLGYKDEYILGPGEAVRITADSLEQIVKPGKKMQICSFLWIYYGYPASSYEGINVDEVRYRLGYKLAKEDDSEMDTVCSIPDSGTCMAIGYSDGKGVPFRNGYVKYTPTWPRSFTPTSQDRRNLVASDVESDGDVDKVLADCDIVIDRTYHTRAFQQAMMETFRTYAEMDRYGRLHVISSTQIVFHCRRILSRALGIPKSRIRVEKPRIGGGFGAASGPSRPPSARSTPPS